MRAGHPGPFSLPVSLLFHGKSETNLFSTYLSDYSPWSLSRPLFLQPSLSGGQFQGSLPPLPSAFSQGQSRT